MAIIVRAMPTPTNDFMAFLQVSTRLRFGDRLYADVWDNKDPLFHYTIALFDVARPWGHFALELAWMSVAVWALQGIGRSLSLPPALRWALATTFTALVLMSPEYFAGYTETPALALSLMAIHVSLMRSPFKAGIICGLVLFFKVTWFPLALCAAASVLLVTDRSRRVAKALVSGIGAVVALVLLVLAWRGEAIPYIEMLRLNVAYAGSDLSSGAALNASTALSLRADLFLGTSAAFSAIIVLTLLIAALFVQSTWNQDVRLRAVVVAGATSLVVAGVVLMLSAKLPHHTRMLAVPLALAVWALAAIAARVRNPLGRYLSIVLPGVALFLASGYVFSTLSSSFTLGAASLRSDPPADSTAAWLDNEALAPSTRIAFLGRGTSVPTRPTATSFALACRAIGQRPTDPQPLLDETIKCLRTADIVVIGDNVDAPDAPRFHDFFRESRTWVTRHLECKKMSEFSVCRR